MISIYKKYINSGTWFMLRTKSKYFKIREIKHIDLSSTANQVFRNYFINPKIYNKKILKKYINIKTSIDKNECINIMKLINENN